MVNNDNKFNGPTVFIQVINNYNFTAPAVIPETVPKQDASRLIDKVMPYFYLFIKWAIKFIPLIIPLHSG